MWHTHKGVWVRARRCEGQLIFDLWRRRERSDIATAAAAAPKHNIPLSSRRRGKQLMRNRLIITLQFQSLSRLYAVVLVIYRCMLAESRERRMNLRGVSRVVYWFVRFAAAAACRYTWQLFSSDSFISRSKFLSGFPSVLLGSNIFLQCVYFLLSIS